MSAVNVLTPNGRRQNVKVQPNTALLQVINSTLILPQCNNILINFSNIEKQSSFQYIIYTAN